LRCIREIAFGPYGGAELFFEDIDGDGVPEILAYQGPGVFGAENINANLDYVKAALPRSNCLSAFRWDGTRMWTWGEPNPADPPYICHAHESCVAAGDIDGDGKVEIAFADGDRVVILDGVSGRVRGEAALPNDNFYIVQVVGETTSDDEAALVVKNGETGYGQWRYGEPVIGLNARLEVVWGPVAIPGGGHHILRLDLDGDRCMEYLIGYCAVKPSGRIAWKVDAVDEASLEPGHDHVDYADVWPLSDGALAVAFAGSSRAYLALAGGETLFVQPDRHVQGCAVGRFRDDSSYQVAIYNDDGPMVLYDADGRELWRKETEERWPLGMPRACEGRVFHRNRPIVRFSRRDRDWILFTDGGWPWCMDGKGEVTLGFEPPPNSRQPETTLPDKARADDCGYGFGTQVLDCNGDGVKEAVIYDRRYLWVFAP